MEKIDVIVVGSGIAGLTFALNAANTRLCRVLIITKKNSVDTATNLAQGGIAAAVSKTDNPKKHFEDTLKAGAYHNNRKAVAFLVKNAPTAIKKLLVLGVPFSKKLTREGGHSERRISFVGDNTGNAIEKILIQQVRKNKNIIMWENAFVWELLVRKKTCYGVRVLYKKKLHDIFAMRIVLATGGIGQIFEYTTNPNISTGDGIALAHREGVKTRDLEFIQFHPTAFYNRGKTPFLISEALRGEGAHIIDKNGKRFVNELTSRDIVARAVYENEQRGPVYLTMDHQKNINAKKRFPYIAEKLKKYGVDLARDRIRIAPAAHYLCGGIVTDLHGRTNIKNLYAFGECAWTGVHGANRLASNSLLEAFVFANQILKTIRSRRHSKKFPIFSKSHYTIAAKNDIREAEKIQKILKKLMWKNVGIVRKTRSLEQNLYAIERLQKKLSKKVHPLIGETRNMLDCALLVTKAALARKKNLGAHYRLD